MQRRALSVSHRSVTGLSTSLSTSLSTGQVSGLESSLNCSLKYGIDSTVDVGPVNGESPVSKWFVTGQGTGLESSGESSLNVLGGTLPCEH